MSTSQFDIIELLRRRQPRQPWDHRLPDGSSPFPSREMDRASLLRRGTGPTTAPLESQQALSQRTPTRTPTPTTSTTNPALQRSVVDLMRASSSPTTTPTPPNLPPPPNEGRQPSAQPVRLGTDIRGLDPQQRQQAHLDLLRSSDPSSKITRTGDFIEESPPEQSPSRAKNALLGLLLGTAQGGIPGGIAGAAVGAVKPRSIQQLLRNRQIEREEGALDKQLERDTKRARLEQTKAQTDELKQDRTRTRYVERGDGVYEISPLYPEGRKLGNIPSEARASRAPVHYENRDDGLYAVFDSGDGIKAVKVPGVPGKPTPRDTAAEESATLAESTQAAMDELKATLDQQKGQLTENERAITQKEAYWNTEAAKRVTAAKANLEDLTMAEALAQVKAEDPDFQSGSHTQTVENTRRLREAIETGDKQISSMREDIRKARAKGRRGGATPPAKRQWSASRWAAANKGGDVNAAKVAAKAAGYTVVE